MFSSPSRLVFVLLAAAVPVFSQVSFHPGFDLGIPLTDTLSSSSSGSQAGLSSSYSRFNSVTKRLVAGPTVRLEFARGFGVEFDALWQRVNYDSLNSSSNQSPASSYQSFVATAANRWQFPLLVQYTHRHIFGEGGLVVSHMPSGHTVSSSQSSGVINYASYVSSPSTTESGFVLGGGVDLRLPIGHLRPQVRFTHWFSQNINSLAYVSATLGTAPVLTGSPILPVAAVRTNPNELSFMLNWTL